MVVVGIDLVVVVVVVVVEVGVVLLEAVYNKLLIPLLQVKQGLLSLLN